MATKKKDVEEEQPDEIESNKKSAKALPKNFQAATVLRTLE